jgi:hypothetical protein
MDAAVAPDSRPLANVGDLVIIRSARFVREHHVLEKSVTESKHVADPVTTISRDRDAILAATPSHFLLRMELDDIEPGRNPDKPLWMSCIESVHPQLPTDHPDFPDLRISMRCCAWGGDQRLLLSIKTAAVKANAARMQQPVPRRVKLQTMDVFECNVQYRPAGMKDTAAISDFDQSRVAVYSVRRVQLNLIRGFLDSTDINNQSCDFVFGERILKYFLLALDPSSVSASDAGRRYAASTGDVFVVQSIRFLRENVLPE